MALIDLTIAKVKDDSGKLEAPGDYTANIAEALKRYSKDRPRLVCADLAGNAGNDLTLPDNWSEGLSSIISIEYPIGDVPETLLDSRDWELYQTPTVKRLRLLYEKPAVGASVRMLYSIMHDEASVPAADLEAVANLAASLCCRQLAAAFGQTGDSLIQADVVNYRSKTDEFRRLAESLEGLYKAHLGIKANDTTSAAMATAAPPDSKRTRLTHGRN